MTGQPARPPCPCPPGRAHEVRYMAQSTVPKAAGTGQVGQQPAASGGSAGSGQLGQPPAVAAERADMEVDWLTPVEDTGSVPPHEAPNEEICDFRWHYKPPWTRRPIIARESAPPQQGATHIAPPRHCV